MKAMLSYAVSALFLMLLVPLVPPASATPTFAVGDVFAGVGSGQVQWRHADGTLQATLTTASAAGFTTGMAFDSSANLYVTEFSSGQVSKFDNHGTLAGPFGSSYSGHPESIVFDLQGNAYVGAVDGDNHIRKFDASGTLVAQYTVATEDRGSDWIDLDPDQCTMYYTSEGHHVKRFNVCTNTQMSDFATLPSDPNNPEVVAYAVYVLPGGDVLVANTNHIYLVDTSGVIVKQYDAPGESTWFAMNLDPGSQTFWSGDYDTSNVYQFDISTGNILHSFNTGTPAGTLFGLGVLKSTATVESSGSITITENAATALSRSTAGDMTCDPTPTITPIVGGITYSYNCYSVALAGFQNLSCYSTTAGGSGHSLLATGAMSVQSQCAGGAAATTGTFTLDGTPHSSLPMGGGGPPLKCSATVMGNAVDFEAHCQVIWRAAVA